MTTPGRLPYPIALTGDGIHLREWRPDDVGALVELLDDPDVARWTPMPAPFDLDAATAYLARARQARTAGHRIQLAITADGGDPLGEVLLFGMDVGRREAELGYLVGARHRRRGLATGSLNLLISYARGALGLDRLVLRIDPRNTASVAVARKAGFQVTAAAPIVQEGPHGSTSLDTWELLDSRGERRVNRLRNVAARRYGQRDR
jgi:RimJ/RimL family protein N-acetyltransferase